MSPSVTRITALGIVLSAGTANATISVLPTEVVGGALVVSEGTFTEIYPGGPGFGPGAGVYGVELVGGRPNAQGREIFVGKNTGTSGAANALQHEITWGTNLRPFTLTWTPTALSITISGTNYLSPASPNNVPLTADGNTLKVFVKGNATLNITEIDGTPIASILEDNGSVFSGAMGGPGNTGVTSANEKHFYSSNNWGGDGFTVKGTLTVLDGGGSGRGIYFKHGNYVPPPTIPEPASWALLIAGFGLIGAAMRRRRSEPVIS